MGRPGDCAQPSPGVLPPPRCAIFGRHVALETGIHFDTPVYYRSQNTQAYLVWGDQLQAFLQLLPETEIDCAAPTNVTSNDPIHEGLEIARIRPSVSFAEGFGSRIAVASAEGLGPPGFFPQSFRADRWTALKNGMDG